VAALIGGTGCGWTAHEAVTYAWALDHDDLLTTDKENKND
jgi:hypothetical protein